MLLLLLLLQSLFDNLAIGLSIGGIGIKLERLIISLEGGGQLPALSQHIAAIIPVIRTLRFPRACSALP